VTIPKWTPPTLAEEDTKSSLVTRIKRMIENPMLIQSIDIVTTEQDYERIS